MRVLICGINFSPELTGTGKYTGELAEWLAVGGHEVRVVTAPPYYPQWRVGEGYLGWRYRKEVVRSPLTRGPGFTPTGRGEMVVYRCPLWVPARPSGWKRILHLASFALSSLPVMLRQVWWRPDVVWVVEPPLFCAPVAVLTARLCGAKAWLHVQDFEVDVAFDLGLLPGGGLRRLVARVERWIMRRFDCVSTISGNMLRRLGDKGVTGGVLFPNWVDLAGLQADDSCVRSFRAELGIPDDAVVALYSGNMGRKQGLEVLAEAARLCVGLGAGSSNPSTALGKEEWLSSSASRRPAGEGGVVFVFCGDGAGRGELVARCAGLSNVRFLDLQPVERLGALLGMADLHLLPQRADAADLVMPSKLTGMFASGRPVVATALAGTQVAEVVAGRGWVVEPGDGAALAAVILELACKPEERACLGRAARDYAVAHWSREAVLGEFERELASLQS
ncbi:MAG: colanic acid biosynthesis glycosyltransferase WcaI [Nitrospirae bacterium CG18_big_fil_WC_8_21_14_2_50_70_55]|nr:glycosyltransferase WbuB [Deltaproteobacteria bacterium]OIP65699.1 MAG: glycosyl transferase [Nitrospirae bacterium CG2_30_70_394]PIQ06080.1 MAG: colanic acid biosynthesis glycosyltransferase WcaI [Nitrospirae bacterium CG18_big_fil_WC_8_21_14_2_50_70_55]PIU79225.1 MAG: colanic acid biosynthesis glycosyltransferase WcaI [Nitrospirae bacterium CG06_land_8_20_14_3_00_70_43]PIW83649.1 MAG: colanic acid biosynthesis glycosyltransferase WcaI [Nitrospirae bacterium CG_4_8_14_3_um_filter_70_85]PIX